MAKEPWDFPASFHGLRKTVMGETLITVSVDRLFVDQIKDLMALDVGSGLYVRMSEAGDSEDEEKKNANVYQKFQRSMHALIRDVAESEGVQEDDVKNRLKTLLKSEGRIKESTTELDLKGYAFANHVLKQWRDHGNS
jgi:hypothetical protein